jgi:ABC-type Fe3+ transport system substrate-binding protein
MTTTWTVTAMSDPTDWIELRDPEADVTVQGSDPVQYDTTVSILQGTYDLCRARIELLVAARGEINAEVGMQRDRLERLRRALRDLGTDNQPTPTND